MDRALGYLDSVSADRIVGWAWDPDRAEAVKGIELYCDGQLLARVTADQHRDDLLQAGKGTGRYGFVVAGLRPVLGEGQHLIEARIAGTETALCGSPCLLSVPAEGPDAALKARLERAVTAQLALGPEAAGFAELYALLAAQLSRMIEAQTEQAQAEPARSTEPLDVLRRASRGQFSEATEALLRGTAERFPALRVLTREAPVASVVIPALNNFALTYRCIESICQASARVPFEVVLVDDGSCDETVLAEFVFPGVRVLRQPVTSGFVRAANAGAAAAQGEMLVFLNNDTEVSEGWLDELVRVFRDRSDTGVAGAMLLFPDGRLQESGGIVWQLGDTLSWGRNADPDDPRFGFLHEADYVSGAALAVPRALFASLGGFDEIYSPGYYEDTDFCFRARAAGWRVVVQPLARVVHHKGATSGDAPFAGMRRQQALNQKRFHERWRDTLATLPPSGGDPERAIAQRMPRRALFLDTLVLTPNQDAGSNAALQHIRLLQRLGYQVTFIPTHQLARIDPYTADLQRMGVECLYVPHVRTVEEGLRRFLATLPQLVYVHRIENARSYLGLVRTLFPAARLVYSVADLHFLRTERMAAVLPSPETESRAALLRRQELDAAVAADRVIVHSYHEAELLARLAPAARVHVVAWPVPTSGAPMDPAGRSGIAFFGGFNHPPNGDAAQRLVQVILPQVQRELPDMRVILAGVGMPDEICALADGPVSVVGHVPDLTNLFAQVRCTAAPLRFGAGLKGKVLTSLAHGVPCIMSPIAVEGIPLPPLLQWMVGASEEEIAAKLVALHRDDALARSLSEQSLDFMRTAYSEGTVLEELRAAVS